MKISRINEYGKINFVSDNKCAEPRSRQQNKVNFEKELMLAQKADSVSANPITSLGYKLYRTFRILSDHEISSTQDGAALNVVV